MSKLKINGVVEFVSTKGTQGAIDAQINDWLEANPDTTIVYVKYRVAIYQDGEKNKMAKMALVLYHSEEEKPDTPKERLMAESQTEKPKKGPGARTMVMSLREGLMAEDEE